MIATGKVIRFDGLRGYGLVSPDDVGEDFFLHMNDLDVDKHLLVPGVRVEFVADERKRRLSASRVKLRDQPQPQAPQAGSVVDNAFCDVLSPSELVAELTERLLADVPDLTGWQIVGVRTSLLTTARPHGWLED